MTWAWVDHACRACGSRLIERRDGETARPAYECGSCGAACHGEARGICGCGILAKPTSNKPAPRFHCTPNPARSTASPAAIVIAWDEATA